MPEERQVEDLFHYQAAGVTEIMILKLDFLSYSQNSLPAARVWSKDCRLLVFPI